jgi:hypothetical protein
LIDALAKVKIGDQKEKTRNVRKGYGDDIQVTGSGWAASIGAGPGSRRQEEPPDWIDFNFPNLPGRILIGKRSLYFKSMQRRGTRLCVLRPFIPSV